MSNWSTIQPSPGRNRKFVEQREKKRPCPNCYALLDQPDKKVKKYHCRTCGTVSECWTCKQLVNRHGECLCTPRPTKKRPRIRTPHRALTDQAMNMLDSVERTRKARRNHGACCLCNVPLASEGNFCKDHAKYHQRYLYWTKRRKVGTLPPAKAIKLMQEMYEREVRCATNAVKQRKPRVLAI